MKDLPLIFIISIFIISCENHSVDNSEEKIINDIFLSLLDSSFYSPVPPPPAFLLDPHEIDVDIDSYSIVKDSASFRSEPDSKRLLIEMEDSLFKLPENINDYIKFDSKDSLSNYYLPETQLLKNNLSNKYIDKSLIKNTDRYVLVDTKVKDTDTTRFVAHIRFSRIYFTSDHESGLFYFTLSCGPDCGKGELIYITINNKKWMIVKRYGLWVS